MSREREVEAVEQWFRRRGLPAVVRNRSSHLLVRTLPATVFMAAVDLMWAVLSVADGTTTADFDRSMESELYFWGYNGLLLGLVVLPCLGAWLAARWGRRTMREGGGLVTAAVITG